MKRERFKRTKSVMASSAIALLVAALVIGVSALTVGTRSASPQHLGFELTGGGGTTCPPTSYAPQTFAVCGPVSPGPTVVPGPTASTVPLKFYNPLSVDIYVTTLTVSFTIPSGCVSSDFTFGGSPVTGAAPRLTGTQPNMTLTFASGHYIDVGPNSGALAGYTYSATLAMANSAQNQNTCEGQGLNMAYTATAQYSETYGTSTAVRSSGSPSVIGQAVIYTATVTAMKGANQDRVPSTPTGAVTFKDGSSSICTSVPVTAGTVSSDGSMATATATCSPSAYIADGTHPITASFRTSDTTEFGDSATSPVWSQVVKATPPAQCAGTYTATIVGTPSNTTITAANGNDAIFAFGANYTVTAGQGGDCFDAGDGNNSISAGNGTDNVVAGNGNDSVNLGNGADSVNLGNGTETVVLGAGPDKVTVGNGSNSTLTAGNNADTVTIGSGSHNTIKLGNGADTTTINGGSNDTVAVGSGNNIIYLGSGTSNTFKGGSGHNVCHVPSSVAALHDTVTNCTVVTP